MSARTSKAVIYEASPAEYQTALELARRAPQPGGVGRIACGTAGWTDPTLLKSGFYPRSVRVARDRLAHYAAHFPFVEVDATYYALLPPAQAEQWLTHTPVSFQFDVKAHPVLTGQPFELRRLPADLQEAFDDVGGNGRVYGEQLPNELALEIEGRFRSFIEPMRVSQRLGAVLLQFPPWFVRSPKNVMRIEQLAQRWHDVLLAVEFRHASWVSDGKLDYTLAMLRQLGLSWVCVDAPEATQLEPKTLAVTNPRLAVVRFHGKNAAGWARKGASVHERFSYLYTPEELRPWTSRLAEFAQQAQTVHATFNNCYRDYAVLNAKGLASLLHDADPDAITSEKASATAGGNPNNRGKPHDVGVASPVQRELPFGSRTSS